MTEGLGLLVQRNTQIPACAGMTQEPLFIRVLDPLQECPKNARRVPFLRPQFSKNRQLRPLFLAYFYSS